MSYNPSDVGVNNGNVFGLPMPQDPEVVILPIPWDVTTSYGGGTALGPETLLEASPQLDLSHPHFSPLWHHAIAWQPALPLTQDSALYRKKAKALIDTLESGVLFTETDQDTQNEINQACLALHNAIKTEVSAWLDKGKKVVLVGGDHSTPWGAIQAHAARTPHFGVLQIDAHMDLRDAYEGFTYSHASIMHHVAQLPQVSSLVQVGIRDFCDAEIQFAKAYPKIKTHFDVDLKDAQFNGITWKAQCEKIVAALPQHVYISVDIDGLDPALCPTTGTPVPGGLSFQELAFLFKTLKETGKTIIGLDLVEIGTTEWDGNVAARLLFNLLSILIG